MEEVMIRGFKLRAFAKSGTVCRPSPWELETVRNYAVSFLDMKGERLKDLKETPYAPTRNWDLDGCLVSLGSHFWLERPYNDPYWCLANDYKFAGESQKAERCDLALREFLIEGCPQYLGTYDDTWQRLLVSDFQDPMCVESPLKIKDFPSVTELHVYLLEKRARV